MGEEETWGRETQREEKAREICGRKRTIERDRAETWERAREGMREMGQRNAERVGERESARARKKERKKEMGLRHGRNRERVFKTENERDRETCVTERKRCGKDMWREKEKNN